MLNDIKLVETKDDEKEQFIKNIQIAFKKAVVEEFGDNGEEIIPREDVINSFNESGAVTYNIVADDKIVGGVVVKIDPKTNHNELLLLFVNVDFHSKGIGYATWQAIEKIYPETKIWSTVTPYFDKRNIHFYVNKCGFHIVEFYNPHNLDPRMNEHIDQMNGDYFDYFFRFEKYMPQK
ncbi:MAG: GNAT family N-acetyltransferase [Selenomonadaceae bacterium]|nr:GNAT family N-acetyltransferase [Selenomonadaceae bacterium]